MSDILAKMQPAFDAIRAAGLSVYVPADSLTGRRPLTYAWFTDGKNIGYIQHGDFGHGFRLSTVHKPNKHAGTGFSLTDQFKALDASALTPDALREAFMAYPHWARHNEREVTKYGDMAAFVRSYYTAIVPLEVEAAA